MSDLEDLAVQLADIDVEETPLTTLTNIELLTELKRLDEELSLRGQLLNPYAPDGATAAERDRARESRDLHSRRSAIVVLLRKRGAM